MLNIFVRCACKHLSKKWCTSVFCHYTFGIFSPLTLPDMEKKSINFIDVRCIDVGPTNVVARVTGICRLIFNSLTQTYEVR